MGKDSKSLCQYSTFLIMTGNLHLSLTFQQSSKINVSAAFPSSTHLGLMFYCSTSSLQLPTAWRSLNHCSRVFGYAIAMSSSLIVPPDGDLNRAVELNALVWSWFVVSLTVVGLRFYSRLALTRNLWWDDWFILLTLLPQAPGLG